MPKELTAPEIESKVYAHIIKKTSKGYTFDFNPLDVSKDGIADELNLDIAEVQEAIERLSTQDIEKSSKIIRIESVKPKFEIWLPSTKGGQKIKDGLCNSGLALKGNLNALYSFLIIVLAYIFIFPYPHLKNFLKIESVDDYFFWGVLITASSVPIGNYLAHKWYQLNIQIQKVPGSKYYVYALILSIILILYSVKKNYNLGTIFSSILIIANIVLVFFQIIRENKHENE